MHPGASEASGSFPGASGSIHPIDTYSTQRSRLVHYSRSRAGPYNTVLYVGGAGLGGDGPETCGVRGGRRLWWVRNTWHTHWLGHGNSAKRAALWVGL